MKKMVYPMEEGLNLEVWMEWDDMVLPDLAKGYEGLIDVFRDLAMGGGMGWSVNPRTGKRESILERALPSDEDFRLAREIASTCPNAPDYIRIAPELLRLARRLCKVADWAVAGKKRTRAFIRRKAMEAWTQCERNSAFVEAEEGAIMVQLRLLAELERTRAKLYRQQGDEQRATGSEQRLENIEKLLVKVAQEAGAAKHAAAGAHAEAIKGRVAAERTETKVEENGQRLDGSFYEEERKRNVALACKRLHDRLTAGKIAPSSWPGEQAARAVLDEMRAEGRLLPHIQERRLLDLYGKWKREKGLD